MKDRNFDDLAHRFRNRIYGGLKGEVRLAVLNRDLAPLLGEGTPRLRVLDAGGGQGQFALDMAGAGHQVTIVDISAAMLDQARERARERGLQGRVELLHRSFQALAESDSCGRYDLVLCHAVLEWLAEPQAAIGALRRLLAPGGHLSLTFYNRRALEFRLLQRGSFRQLDRNVESGHWGGHPGSLTPQNPLQLEWVQDWLTQHDLAIVSHSGIRCFHDYMTPTIREKLPASAIVEKELEYSRVEPYRQLARYVHLLCRS
ncbi:SAM-dependent methyltransferase [Microbulbifer flavimaris]|uniref:tRNA 5-carboxymethoxyuridine methyltransferase n=1 Tax=Microbulbifer flavimaris TaxID=1781068 RepID=A0ABX4I2R8_9GAMM|nr:MULTISPECIES: methyltransferase domain-containing protein [Microbulbifer]KUJ84625.1 smtA protein [Microbulbifer sp. ZGT114]PCO06714.1 SAM-dependent methyltransferase [Microbulbifer flavimaris]